MRRLALGLVLVISGFAFAGCSSSGGETATMNWRDPLHPQVCHPDYGPCCTKPYPIPKCVTAGCR